MTAFSSLGLSPNLLTGIEALGFETMTPIQAHSLPFILQSRDIIAQAPTGSGKTAAFGLGVLNTIDPQISHTQALILCPTRELADQVGRQLRKLATGIPNLKLLVLTGGMPLAPQIASLEAQDPHIVVGTPGRIQELLLKKVVHLGRISSFVLDEADRMLDMGFEDAIKQISRRLPAKRQNLLFSATFPQSILEISQQLLNNPEHILVGQTESPVPIEQLFCASELSNKQKTLASLLQKYRPESCVVFCNTRRDVDDVALSLQQFGFTALALHGDMEQRDRDEIWIQFANASCPILVASDVAARGLDIVQLSAVFNYELPTDADSYTHRIGRTARAGERGLAISLVSPREMPRTNGLQENSGSKLQWITAPTQLPKKTDIALPKMATLRIDGGKTDKLRPTDILGALTNGSSLTGNQIGKIMIYPTRSYVAIEYAHVNAALKHLEKSKIKAKKFRVRRI